jgi:hypothetical protein
VDILLLLVALEKYRAMIFKNKYVVYNAAKVTNAINPQTSSIRLWYQVFLMPYVCKCDVSPCRRTYSIHQNAVSTGFWGRSLNFFETRMVLILYLRS